MAIVVAFLLYSMLNMKKAEEERQASLVITYALKTDVKSGDTIDASKLATVTTDKLAAPANAVKASALTENTIAKIDLTREDVMNSPYYWVQNGDEIFLTTRSKNLNGFGKDPIQTLTTGVSLVTTAITIYLILTRL